MTDINNTTFTKQTTRFFCSGMYADTGDIVVLNNYCDNYFIVESVDDAKRREDSAMYCLMGDKDSVPQYNEHKYYHEFVLVLVDPIEECLMVKDRDSITMSKGPQIVGQHPDWLPTTELEMDIEYIEGKTSHLKFMPDQVYAMKIALEKCGIDSEEESIKHYIGCYYLNICLDSNEVEWVVYGDSDDLWSAVEVTNPKHVIDGAEDVSKFFGWDLPEEEEEEENDDDEEEEDKEVDYYFKYVDAVDDDGEDCRVKQVFINTDAERSVDELRDMVTVIKERVPDLKIVAVFDSRVEFDLDSYLEVGFRTEAADKDIIVLSIPGEE